MIKNSPLNPILLTLLVPMVMVLLLLGCTHNSISTKSNQTIIQNDMCTYQGKTYPDGAVMDPPCNRVFCDHGRVIESMIPCASPNQ